MDLSHALSQLEAAAEPSRLRLLAGLLPGESPVGDLVTVLDQSQPRVSRHLRLLAEAGLVESFREGRSIFYRLSDATLADGIGVYLGGLADGADPTVRRDLERLARLRRQRERDALRKLTRSGGGASDVAEAVLAEALAAVLGPSSLGDLLDVGVGTGTLLRLLGPRARRSVGVDRARDMRQLARARLQGAGLRRWSIREAEGGSLPFPDASFDLIVLDEVLGGPPAGQGHRGTDQPQQIIAEALRCLRESGRLLVLDRILPGTYPAAGNHRSRDESQIVRLLQDAGLTVTQRQWLPGRVPDRALFLAINKPAPGAHAQDRRGQSPNGVTVHG